MKLIEKRNTLFFPEYDYTIIIIVTNSIEKSRNLDNEEIGHMLSDSFDCIVGLHCYNSKKPTSYIYLNKKADPGTIVHECWHSIYRMFEWIEAEIENEIVAYTLGYLVEEVHKFIKQK